MRVRPAGQYLALKSKKSFGEVDLRFDVLREAGALPKGGRGTGAPEISVVHAALMCLTLPPSRPVDVLPALQRSVTLEYLPVPGVPGALFGIDDNKRVTLPAVISWLLHLAVCEDELILESLLKGLDVAADGSFAVIASRYQGVRRDLVFVTPEVKARAKGLVETHEQYDNQGINSVEPRFSFGVGFLQSFAWQLRAARAGWVDERTSDPLADEPKPLPPSTLAGPEFSLESVGEMIARLTTHIAPADLREPR